VARGWYVWLTDRDDDVAAARVIAIMPIHEFKTFRHVIDAATYPYVADASHCEDGYCEWVGVAYAEPWLDGQVYDLE